MSLSVSSWSNNYNKYNSSIVRYLRMFNSQQKPSYTHTSMESSIIREGREGRWVYHLVCRNANCVCWEGARGVPVCGSSPGRETLVHSARHADVMSISSAAQSGLGEGGRRQLGHYYISIGLHVPSFYTTLVST